MATTGPDRGWWGEQCPKRGPALSHAHSSECSDIGHNGRCCHCFGRPGETPSAPVPVPINVNDRLRDLGLMPEPSAAPLTDDEKRRLEVIVLGVERKRGYR